MIAPPPPLVFDPTAVGSAPILSWSSPADGLGQVTTLSCDGVGRYAVVQPDGRVLIDIDKLRLCAAAHGDAYNVGAAIARLVVAAVDGKAKPLSGAR